MSPFCYQINFDDIDLPMQSADCETLDDAIQHGSDLVMNLFYGTRPDFLRCTVYVGDDDRAPLGVWHYAAGMISPEWSPEA
jgi:hypothetical protein